MGSQTVAVLTLDDSYFTASANALVTDSVDDPGWAQSFISGGGVLQTAKFYLQRNNSPTGNSFAKLYAATGTHGTNAKPTGSALATSDSLDVTTIGTASLVQKTFTFSGANQITLSASTTYCVQFFFNGGDGTNYIWVGTDRTLINDDGNASEEKPVGTFASAGIGDVYFEVWVLR